MPIPVVPPRPGARPPRILTTHAEVLHATGDDAFIRFDVAPDEVESALALDGAVALDRRIEGFGDIRIFLGEPGGIEELLVHLLDDAAHMDTIPFDTAQVPQSCLKMLKKHAVLGRGGTWDWMWTQTVPEVLPDEDRVVELDGCTADGELRAFLKKFAPEGRELPGRDRRLWTLGVRNNSDELVATATAFTTKSGHAHLASVAVGTSARRMGLGRLVTTVATRRALELTGACTLGLYSENDAARGLMEQLGYQEAHAWATYHLVAAKL